MRDVASMIRSYHEAAWTSVLDPARVRPEDQRAAEPWAELWRAATSAAFLRGYLGVPGVTALLPPAPADTAALLDAFLLEAAIDVLCRALDAGATPATALRFLASLVSPDRHAGGQE
jgi:maltose alpha-D-glucosyltransferase/alpha-amylase